MNNMAKEMFIDTNFYGIISGKVSETFAQAINQKMENANVVAVWDSIETFQRNVGRDAKSEVQGIKAIVVTDYAFAPKMTVEAKAFAFHFMQSMFKDKSLYGIHLILYTKDQNLLDTLDNRYRENEEEKYEGTRMLLCAGEFSTTAIIKVFKSPFALLSYDDKKKKEMERILEEARRQEDRRISNKGFIMLLGKQQALQEEMEYLQRELVIINRKIVEYATALNDDNLDLIVDDLTMGVLDNLDEKYDKFR